MHACAQGARRFEGAGAQRPMRMRPTRQSQMGVLDYTVMLFALALSTTLSVAVLPVQLLQLQTWFKCSAT